MRMFNKSGTEVLVDKEQVPALEQAGWTKTAPEKTEDSADAPAPAEETATPVRKKRAPIKKA